MAETRQHRLVPYELVAPGFEGVYTGEKSATLIEETELVTSRSTDDQGNVIVRWPVFPWTFPGQEKQWDEEIQYLNFLQSRLGPLRDATRQIRAHIGSLVPCDSGLPVTVDELLDAIGRGKLDEPSFRNGCWCPGMWWQHRTTQPLQRESMQAIHAVLSAYLAGKSAAEAELAFPHALGFLRRTYSWLGPLAEFTEVKRLMLQRMLLTVEFFTKISDTVPFRVTDKAYLEAAEAACSDLFADGGRGAALDTEIAEKAYLPKIRPRWEEEYRKNLEGIEDPAKLELYEICCEIASGVHTLSDCHHSTFRYLENWIYGIGTGQSDIPSRRLGTERERLARLLFGYVLGLDKWLIGVPMQLLLLDLGHADLSFDPKNEVVRVYAYLGEERTPVKQWLAACLWHNLNYSLIDREHPAGLNRHQDLLERASSQGISVREWMDSVKFRESSKTPQRTPSDSGAEQQPD